MNHKQRAYYLLHNQYTHLCVAITFLIGRSSIRNVSQTRENMTVRRKKETKRKKLPCGQEWQLITLCVHTLSHYLAAAVQPRRRDGCEHTDVEEAGLNLYADSEI